MEDIVTKPVSGSPSVSASLREKLSAYIAVAPNKASPISAAWVVGHVPERTTYPGSIIRDDVENQLPRVVSVRGVRR